MIEVQIKKQDFKKVVDEKGYRRHLKCHDDNLIIYDFYDAHGDVKLRVKRENNEPRFKYYLYV